MLNVRLAGEQLYGKWLFTWLSLVMSLMVSFCAVLFPTRCLGLDLGLIDNVPLTLNIFVRIYTFISYLFVQITDIDECAEGTDLCSQDCINTIGSYECQCSAGYKSSGYSCTGSKALISTASLSVLDSYLISVYDHFSFV